MARMRAPRTAVEKAEGADERERRDARKYGHTVVPGYRDAGPGDTLVATCEECGRPAHRDKFKVWRHRSDDWINRRAPKRPPEVQGQMTLDDDLD